MKILLPIDFSEVTDRVISETITCAKAFGAEIELLHILQPIPQALLFEETFPVIPYGEAYEKIEEERDALLKSIEKRLKEEGLRASSAIRDGNPAGVILEHQQESNSDWIVLGSHGHGALYHLVLGSVSERVVDKATCPVLVVKK